MKRSTFLQSVLAIFAAPFAVKAMPPDVLSDLHIGSRDTTVDKPFTGDFEFILFENDEYIKYVFENREYMAILHKDGSKIELMKRGELEPTFHRPGFNRFPFCTTDRDDEVIVDYYYKIGML